MNSLKILHICGDYPNQTLYKKMFDCNNFLGVKQICYVPVRRKELIGKNNIDSLVLNYSYILRRWHKFLYFTKIKMLKNDVLSSVSLREIKLIHAHTLFSDGGVAYELYKKYNIPYIVAVRNVDINYYFKYAFHLRHYGYKILKHAQKVIFINASYKSKLFSILPENIKSIMNEKSLIIPNGIDNFWHLNKEQSFRKIDDNKINLIYVGDFSKNKNIQSIIKVVNTINLNNKLKCSLKIVGGGGNNEKEILKEIYKNSNITYLGRIKDIEILKTIYRSCDIFVMPSFHETFGLVYLEALSQGLPIIYSQNEGIDGFFTNELVGKAVNPYSVCSLQKSVEWVHTNYDFLNKNICKVELNDFKWETICKIYLTIYDSNN